MSYSMAPAPAPKQRPAVVTAAGYLLYLVAGLLAINTIVSLATISKAEAAVRKSFAGTGNESAASSAFKIGVGVSVVLDVLLIILVVLLAIYDMRGRNGMRITTWVIAGLGVLCLSCGAFGNVTGSTLAKQNNAAGQNVTINIKDVIPSWAKDVQITVDILSVLSLIVVIILLALSASNEFFRKGPQAVPGYPGGWQAVPGQAFPQDPAYPAYPTLPPTAAGSDPAFPTLPPTDQPPQDPTNPAT